MKSEFTFLSADGKTSIHAVKLTPEGGAPRAVLQLVHGMVEYIDRYDPFASFMAEQGFVVVGHDHLGHGASVSSQEQWGYFAPDHPSDILVEDMQQLRRRTEEEYPDLPYFILGHSMGSYLLRKYLTVYGQGLAGSILSGTGFVPPSTCAMAKMICSIMAKFKGWKYRSKFVSSLTFGKSYQKFDRTGAKPELSWLTKDVDIVRKYYGDPRCTFLFTLNGFFALFDMVGYDCKQENVDKIPKDLPILIASGKDDPVGDLGDGVKTVHTMFQEAGIKDLAVSLYEHDRHEILNELDKEKVFDDILNWLQTRI